MRRILALTLAIIMCLSLIACKGNEDDTTESEPTVTDPAETNPTETEPSETEDTSGIYDTAPLPETDAPETDEPSVTDAPDEDGFLTVNETVYVYGTTVLNVRKEPSAQSEKVGEMKEGEQVTRIGYNSSWSKISYYGSVCYASSDYLTTDAPLSFKAQTDTVYITAEGSLNLRKKPSRNADIVAFLPYGTELSRTGVATKADSDGIIWSRLLYNGEVCYASSSYLANEEPLNEFEMAYENVYIVNTKDGKPIESLNLRATPSLSGNIYKSVPADTQLLRIGIAKKADEDGIVWSKLLCADGTVCYASSSYLTTLAPDALPVPELPTGYTVYRTDDLAFVYPLDWQMADGTKTVIKDDDTGNSITVSYDEKVDHTKYTKSTFSTKIKPELEKTGIKISNVILEQTKNNGVDITLYDYDAVTSDGDKVVQTLIYVNTSARTYSIIITQPSIVSGLVKNVRNSISVLR